MSSKTIIALSLLPQFLMVQWLSKHPEWIERHYSEGAYPIISKAFRSLYGWVPFSVGDVVYTLLILLGLGYVYRHWRYIKAHKGVFVRDLLMVCSLLYFTFYMAWGLNYFRAPLKTKLGLTENTEWEALVDFTEKLIAKTNAEQEQLAGDSLQKVVLPYTQEEMFGKTLQAYATLSQRYPFLTYEAPSIKTSLYSTALTYMGYAGYLNPFTNEAQVNARLPAFRFPVVAGHEIGHQLGYSAENETNFIGYLVTANNKDPYFKYAAHAYALGYCLNDIRRADEARFETLWPTLNAGVQENFREMSHFWQRYENPMEPVFKSIFNSFLKANKQPEGLRSYNAVVSLLVAHHQEAPL
ncbi:DUF3810 domain-containing protein [Maribacter sp. 2307ULW6-5]|uniref:DUF3810 domain-containing protein n=1 Tax=Maribacter sp. 2307ULW6-5 TaxID=3386275 RepID=UPI0039BD8785